MDQYKAEEAVNKLLATWKQQDGWRQTSFNKWADVDIKGWTRTRRNILIQKQKCPKNIYTQPSNPNVCSPTFKKPPCFELPALLDPEKILKQQSFQKSNLFNRRTPQSVMEINRIKMGYYCRNPCSSSCQGQTLGKNNSYRRQTVLRLDRNRRSLAINCIDMSAEFKCFKAKKQRSNIRCGTLRRPAAKRRSCTLNNY